MTVSEVGFTMPEHKKAYHAVDEPVYEETHVVCEQQKAKNSLQADPGSFVREGLTLTDF